MDLTNFDNKHLNQRGFVIGGGPSILDLQNRGFSFASLKNEIKVGVNKAYLLTPLNYLVWTDGYFWKEFHEEIEKLKCVKFCPNNVAKKFGVVHQKDVLILTRHRDSKQEPLSESFKDPLPMWNNSGVTGLRIAYLLGLNPIYLLGIDIKRIDDQNRTHFHTDYDNNRIEKTKDIRYEKFYTAFTETIKAIANKGVTVYSCSKTSRLNDTIKYVDVLTL